MDRLILDTSEVTSNRELHAVLQRDLRLPSHYEKNLDALWNYLTSWLDLPLTIEWHGFEEAEKALGEDAIQVQATLRKAQSSLPGFLLVIVKSKSALAICRCPRCRLLIVCDAPPQAVRHWRLCKEVAGEVRVRSACEAKEIDFQNEVDVVLFTPSVKLIDIEMTLTTVRRLERNQRIKCGALLSEVTCEVAERLTEKDIDIFWQDTIATVDLLDRLEGLCEIKLATDEARTYWRDP